MKKSLLFLGTVLTSSLVGGYYGNGEGVFLGSIIGWIIGIVAVDMVKE